MEENYGDPFVGKRAKAAIRSEGVMGGTTGIASTLLMAYASYQANGTLSEGEITALIGALVSLAISIKGRVNASRPIGKLF